MKRGMIILCMLLFPLLMMGVNDTIVETSNTDIAMGKAIEKFINVVEKTGNFVMDQAPLLIQEFFTWRIFLNIVGIILGIGIFLLGRYLPYVWLDKEEGINDYKYFTRWGDEEATFAWTSFGLGCVISFITLLICIMSLMQIIIAPKLYLIEYFGYVIK